MTTIGSVIRVAGPVVEAKGMAEAVMHEMVEVGNNRLIGEIIRLERDNATIQVYENTSRLKLDEPVTGTGSPLSVELAPGILGTVFDGIQRPLEEIRHNTGPFIKQSANITPLSRTKKWHFVSEAKVGNQLIGGDILGTVQETALFKHRILVPPKLSGKLVNISTEGEFTINDTIATLVVNGKEVSLPMLQKWPVREPRPHSKRLLPSTPLITGQRIIDTFFPIAKGGSASIPGPFGSGKTVTQQQLAKWSDANVIIYVGCGERGNEMVDVLDSFPELIDPSTGRPLMERTVLVANTSNMPVSAREASIYTGIALAEYFRDMGYAVALMADSTSRWAEALREVSGRLEEMPAEEGFPSYLPSRLAEFYERTGVVETLGSDKRIGSICAIGAVSPPGGDFSEPVTQNTKRFTRVFWALDSELASARHYPSINWMSSYSGYIHDLAEWWHTNVDKNWNSYRAEAMRILQAEDDLKNIVKLVGPEALPDRQRLILETARIIRIAFLQQNALDSVDTYSTPQKQFKMLKIIVDYHRLADNVVSKGSPISKVTEMPITQEIMRMKNGIPNDRAELLDDLEKRMHASFVALETTMRQ